jgi:NAD(P)-dependent dehydrogenase (short-subunit alcohol dehydrogenase family)
MKRLEDRICVVTGAGSGIGRAVSELLARRGAILALVDVDAEGLAGTASRIHRFGRRATEHVVDVSDKARMAELVREVEHLHGGAHVLVNNAGVSVGATFEQHSLDDFEWLMGINFWGVVYGCKLFLPLLRRAEEAHIVNVSSVFGMMGMPLNSAYCASKFAVRGLSECLRAELAGTGIGVTSVHPGGIATNIVKHARFVDPDGLEGLHERAKHAFERMLPPEKAAEAIVRGIERNRARVLITREAYLIDAAKRLMPVLAGEIVGKRWRKQAERLHAGQKLPSTPSP